MNKKHFFPVSMTIAGSDSGGGAGIQADLRTFAALGTYGTSAITALTAQNPKGVSAIFPVSPEFLNAQIVAILSEFEVKALKTGMLFSKELIQTATNAVKDFPGAVIVDPVMVSTSGSRLLQNDAIECLKKNLLPRATLITPNLFEAEIISGQTIRSLNDMKLAAQICVKQFGCGVIIKGGHSENPDNAVDYVLASGEEFTLSASRLDLPELTTHGTGCTFSAAITAGIAKGLDIKQSISEAKQFVWDSLKNNVRSGRDFHSMFPPFCRRENAV